MKRYNRVLCGILAVCLMVVLITVQVSAAGYAWVRLFSGFQTLSPGCGNTYAGYTKPLQMFLECYDSGWSTDIMNAGGVDGDYGDVTATCLGKYKIAKSLKLDKVCDASTWGCVGGDLNAVAYGDYMYFSYGSGDIIRANNSFPVKFQYYYLQNGNTALSGVFHTAYS